MYWNRHNETYWNIESLAGHPEINNKTFDGYDFLHIGDILTTDAISRVKLRTGSVGSLVIEPNSRIKLLSIMPGTHKIYLDRGTTEVSRWGSPFNFYIQTPAGLVIDNGSDYKLIMDQDLEFIHSESGTVILQDKGEESIINAGADCVSKKDVGPGTPYYPDAPKAFIAALYNFDFTSNKDTSISVILSNSRVKDVLSLWHLLYKTKGEDQKKIFDAINSKVSIPTYIDFTKVANGDKIMLNRLGEYLRIGKKIY
jgi:hypothetical protein